MPAARGANSSKRSRGFSQISRRHDFLSRRASKAIPLAPSRSSPSVTRSTTAPSASRRLDQCRLKARSAAPMRVPPYQSSTVRPTRSIARSTSWSRSSRVTLVSRVPNRKVWMRSLAFVSVWKKCSRMRE